jgi:hypothetical protein
VRKAGAHAIARPRAVPGAVFAAMIEALRIKPKPIP